jgi:putative transcriptional regulator
VYFGGPVQTERGFVLHDAGPTDEADLQLHPDRARGPGHDHQQGRAGGHRRGAGPKRVLVTLGYSGWGAGQLEDELGRNGWLTVPADPAIIFDTPVDERYMKALALLGSIRACFRRKRGTHERWWPVHLVVPGV